MSSYLKWEKKIIKREIKHKIIAGIDKNELVKLEFGYDELKNLRWEHSKEFEYNGEMYDIVETEIKKEKVIYYCWWDNEETKLNRQLNNLLNIAWSEHSNDPNSPLKTIKLVFGEWLHNHFESLICKNHLTSLEKNETYFLQKKYETKFQEFCPPPKLN